MQWRQIYRERAQEEAGEVGMRLLLDRHTFVIGEEGGKAVPVSPRFSLPCLALSPCLALRDLSPSFLLISLSLSVWRSFLMCTCVPLFLLLTV